MPGRISFAQYLPSLQFRYEITSTKLPEGKIYARSASLPSAEHAPVTLEYINTYFKVKGKTRWNDITLSCYAYEGFTMQQVYDWTKQMHKAADNQDDYKVPYYEDMVLKVLDPAGNSPAGGTWTLHGAFIASSNWGSMDWGTDDAIQVEVVVVYDWASYNE